MFFKKSRRSFLTDSTLAGAGFFASLFIQNKTCQATPPLTRNNTKSAPIIISTWNSGVAANKAALQVLQNKGTALDAVEAGVKTAEANPDDASVGYGGYPDREGYVSLDASIMDWNGNAGAVWFLEHIKHPVSVARRVMEKTPHLMLAGEGALQFALAEGFQKENLLTEHAKKAWEVWKTDSKYQPVINIENHDTIGTLAIDYEGRLAGACTTSGLAFKMRGRVGDSPIIGAGLYVDNEVGGAIATGLGEAVQRTLGSFLIVELMRNGMSPQQACAEAINRIKKKHKDFKHFQVAFCAVNKSGQYGAFSLQPGFSFALWQKDEHHLFEAKSLL